MTSSASAPNPATGHVPNPAPGSDPAPLPHAAVLFDCDGVLVDSEPITNGVLREMLAELGWDLSPQECIRRFVGRALRDEWRVIEEHTGVRIDEAWLHGFRARRDARLRERLTAIEGAGPALEAVSRAYGSGIAVATGADRFKCEMQLGLTGLDRFFAGRVFSGMEMARSKPAPDVYLAAAAALRVDPARTAVVEDSAAGVRAGVAAGARVLGFCRGDIASTPAPVLVEAGAAEIFTDMRELPGLLGV